MLQVLRKYPNGLRYNALHRECNKILRLSSRTGVCIRTFNKYLNRLVEVGFVKRNEVTRFAVFYELNFPETSEIKEFRSLFQQLLLIWRKQLSTILKLLKKLLQAGYKDEEALKRLKPEFKTFMVMTCKGLVESAGGLTEQALLQILMFEAIMPTVSRWIVEDVAVSMRSLFTEFADWIETAHEERALLLQFFRDVATEITEENEARVEKAKEIALKLGVSLPEESMSLD